VVGCCAEEVSYGAGEVSTVADKSSAVADGLPTTADGLPSSLEFGDGERGGADEEVDAGDEDPDVDKDAPCAPSAPPTHMYSMVKSQSAAADPSSTALSHAQPRPSSNTTLRATCMRRVTGLSTR
jgi:hypothetical protein